MFEQECADIIIR